MVSDQIFFVNMLEHFSFGCNRCVSVYACTSLRFLVIASLEVVLSEFLCMRQYLNMAKEKLIDIFAQYVGYTARQLKFRVSSEPHGHLTQLIHTMSTECVVIVKY